MERCVRYHLTLEEAKSLLFHIKDLTPNDVSTILTANEFYEVWYGLPAEYEFKKEEARNGENGLLAKGKDFYIYAPPRVRERIEQDREQIFIALGKRSTKSIKFEYVDLPAEEFTLASATTRSKKLNQSFLDEAAKELIDKRKAKKPKKN